MSMFKTVGSASSEQPTSKQANMAQRVVKRPQSDSSHSSAEDMQWWFPTLGSSSSHSHSNSSASGTKQSDGGEQRGGEDAVEAGTGGAASSSELMAMVGARAEGLDTLDTTDDQLRSICMDILTEIPKDKEGRPTSIGTIGHFKNECTPCCYWYRGICRNGVACRNCHMMHEGQKAKKLRPSKQARQKAARQKGGETPSSDPASSTFRALLEPAVPSAPGPVDRQAAELKVTVGVLQQVVQQSGYKVSTPHRGTKLRL